MKWFLYYFFKSICWEGNQHLENTQQIVPAQGQRPGNHLWLAQTTIAEYVNRVILDVFVLGHFGIASSSRLRNVPPLSTFFIPDFVSQQNELCSVPSTRPGLSYFLLLLRFFAPSGMSFCFLLCQVSKDSRSLWPCTMSFSL